MRATTIILAFLLIVFVGCIGNKNESNNNHQTKFIDKENVKHINSTVERFKAEYVNQNLQNKIIAEAFLNDSDPNGANVREVPGGKVIKVLRTDVEWMIDVCEAWNGWFRISPIIDSGEVDAIELKTENCWIHGSLMASDTRNYGGQSLNFHTKPDDKSVVAFTVNQEVRVTFIDIMKDWAKVCYTNESGKKLIGWIELEWLCPNPYTNCC